MSKARELSELGDKITVDGSGNSAFTGNVSAVNITVSGTVDGRDVAADGTKLDGIESGATADQTASEILTAIKTVDGAGSGLDADSLDGKQLATIETEYQSYADTAVSNLVAAAPTTLDTLNELAAALGDDPNFATTVTNSIATKLPLAGGTMTGNITFNSTQLFDGRDVSADGAKLDGIEAGADVTDTANVTAAGALMTTGGTLTGNLSLGDNDKAVFGAGSDLQIFHDGSNSVITNSTGSLIIRDSVGGNILIQGIQNEPSIDAIANGAVNLYYDANQRLATTSTGVSVTGTVAATAFTGDGSGLTGIQTSPYDQSTSSTGFFALPSGTTAQRPGSPANGYIRYNSTIGGIEEYRNGGWFTLSQLFTGASGGSVTTSGSYTIHTFTSSGTFTVSGGAVNVEYLVIGGGGGGATQASSNNRGGGGGGAGGYRTNVSGQTSGGNSSAEGTKTLGVGSYTVTVGGGGAGGSGGYYQLGASGNNSVFDNITSNGGGRGGAGNGTPGASGGSGGGGGSGDFSGGGGNGGSGTSGQGFGGGNGTTSGSYSGGTGGGAGGAGQNALSGIGIRRAGGAGLSSNITGSSVTRGVGGGSLVGDNEQSGAANTGNGGDGGGGTSAGSGGSGIVIIRYLTP